jgi:hypothetical protein
MPTTDPAPPSVAGAAGGGVALVLTKAYCVPFASSVVAPTVAVVAPVAVPVGLVSTGAVTSAPPLGTNCAK